MIAVNIARFLTLVMYGLGVTAIYSAYRARRRRRQVAAYLDKVLEHKYVDGCKLATEVAEHCEQALRENLAEYERRNSSCLSA